jgi:hypothetical protein
VLAFRAHTCHISATTQESNSTKSEYSQALFRSVKHRALAKAFAKARKDCIALVVRFQDEQRKGNKAKTKQVG